MSIWQCSTSPTPMQAVQDLMTELKSLKGNCREIRFSSPELEFEGTWIILRRIVKAEHSWEPETFPDDLILIVQDKHHFMKSKGN